MFVLYIILGLIILIPGSFFLRSYYLKKRVHQFIVDLQTQLGMATQVLPAKTNNNKSHYPQILL